MGAIESHITSLTIVSSTVYSKADQRKHQSSASLALVRGIHRWPVNSPHKWPVTRKMFPFDDVIMNTRSCAIFQDLGGHNETCCLIIENVLNIFYDGRKFEENILNCVVSTVPAGCPALWYAGTSTDAGPLFTKRTDVLLQDLAKSRSREIGCFNDHIALIFDRHLHSTAADVPAKFQSDWQSLIPNLAASRLHEILR